MTIRVGVYGAAGRMGATVCQMVEFDPELQLVAAIDPKFAGTKISEVAKECSPEVLISGDREDFVKAQVEVAIDFTHHDACMSNMAFCAKNGIHTVIGTSGFTEDEFDQIRSSFTSSNCIIAPNFAIGGVLMMRFAELAAPFFETAEIVETHHDAKLDAPSGTAIATAERMAKASQSWADDPTEHFTIEGARGAAGPAGIPIHSLRIRGMVAHQEIVLGTAGQALTIRHDSFDRESFMPGVALATKRIGSLSGLTIGLDEVLGI